MRLVRLATIAAVAVIGVAAAVSTAEAKKCSQASGEGTGLGEELAKSNATMALNDAITKMGGKGAGKVAYKCGMTLPLLSTCTASQRACK